MGGKSPRARVMGAMLAGVLAWPSLADVLTLKDGRTLNGRVVSDDGRTVVFEARVRGMRMTARYHRESVASLVREEIRGKTYYALPISGPIGKQKGVEGAFVTAAMFRSALAEVREAKPDYVVLVIDSPGGSLDEMQGIIEAINESPDLTFVAYVKKAISAAAIIAMRCPTVCMATGGTMGGAVPFRLGPDGTPQVIEEKFQSILRAEFRRAAELGGHSPLIAQAMMDADLELWMRQEKGKPVVSETSRPGAVCIKRKGQILTLTAAEATASGVSVGIAERVEDVAKPLGIGAWGAIDDKAWYEMINAAEAQQWHDQRERQRAGRVAAWVAATKAIRAEMEAISERLKHAEARHDAAVRDAQALIDARKEQLDALQKEWDAQRVSIAGTSTTNSALNATTRRRLADLDATYTARRNAIKERTDPEIDEGIRKAKAEEAEMRKLYDEWVKLRDKLPPRPAE